MTVQDGVHTRSGSAGEQHCLHPYPETNKAKPTIAHVTTQSRFGLLVFRLFACNRRIAHLATNQPVQKKLTSHLIQVPPSHPNPDTRNSIQATVMSKPTPTIEIAKSDRILLVPIGLHYSNDSAQLGFWMAKWFVHERYSGIART